MLYRSQLCPKKLPSPAICPLGETCEICPVREQNKKKSSPEDDYLQSKPEEPNLPWCNRV
jgi:hypothetical protein